MTDQLDKLNNAKTPDDVAGNHVSDDREGKQMSKKDNSLFSPCLRCKAPAYHWSGICQPCRKAEKEKQKAKK